MFAPAWVLASICTNHPLALRGGLLIGLAAAGAAGSATHCLPMCGPFVLGQTADRLARIPATRLTEACRYKTGFLTPYHLGRLTTYAAIGAIAASFGHFLSESWTAKARALPLLAAGLCCLALAAGKGSPAGLATRFGRRWQPLIRRFNRDNFAGTYLFGAALGFLPCGLVYAALAAAATSGGPAWGAACMLAFGAGTVPLLAALGVAGHARNRLSGGIRRAGAAILLFNAVVLGLMALRDLA